MTRIHILALRHSAFYSPLLAAIAGGFLRDEGLDPSYRPANPGESVTDGIARGAVQLAQSAVATQFAPLERGESPDIRHFAQINERDGFFLVGRRAEPDFRWSQLAGRRVLADHFFQPLAMLRYAAHKQGMDLAQVELIDAGDPERMERGFRNGQADYVHLQGPAAQQLEHDGIGRIVAAVGDVIGPVAFSSLCASRAWLATDAARAFMRGYRRARQFVIDTPAPALAALEAGFFPGTDRAVLTHTIAAYQALGCWTPETRITRATYAATLDVFQHSGAISRRHDYELVVAEPPGFDQSG